MSALCQKRTPAVQQRKLFDHLVCKCEKIGQNGEAQRLGGFQIQRAHPCEGQDGRMTALPVV
jgi:hypothetical protein